ncbi:MAG: wax ester/triacylglycerol synthase family O-acyltransferase [Myxococcales bacterium]|nr:wax ester/triacylglycerol synthase family O-acyltransferase [Myxococcales bacterium]
MGRGPRNSTPLSDQDALFLDAESEASPMHVAVVLVFAPGPTTSLRDEAARSRIARFLERGLAIDRRYAQRLDHLPLSGRPIWVDDPDFDLDRHVRSRRLPAPGREAQLRTVCAELVAQPLDRTRPLWEVWLLDGLEGDRFALLVKVHHCLVDGVAGIGLMGAILGVEPASDFESRPLRASGESPLRAELALREIRRRVDAGLELAERGVRALHDPRGTLRRARRLGRGLRRLVRLDWPPASRTGLDAPHEGRRQLAFMATDLERIEAIRARWGGTLNDVVVATVDLALQDYLEDHGLDTRHRRELDLRVAIPVDRRSATEPDGVADRGNHISMIFARIPSGERSPSRVYARVSGALAQAKVSHMAEALEAVMTLAGWSPQRLTRALTRRALALHVANLVVTNVRGPSAPLYLLDAPLERTWPIVPLMPGQTLAVAVMSYAGRLHWGFHADRAGVRDLNHWSILAERAFERLHAEATGSGRHGGAERRGTRLTG